MVDTTLNVRIQCWPITRLGCRTFFDAWVMALPKMLTINPIISFQTAWLLFSLLGMRIEPEESRYGGN